MAADARSAAPAYKASGTDPLRFTWQLLTNVKFALLLVGTAAAACLLGVVLPQLPGPMRSNVAARSAWLEMQRGQYGFLTDTMNRLQLFDVFHSVWFNGLWFVLIVAVTVCTVSRFMPTWRSVEKPTKVVGDGYFARAHHSASFTHAGGPEAVEEILRKRHYHVERTKLAEDGSVYLFAERFAWSQYGTFLSHLALLILLVGALLTVTTGFDRTFVLAEGTPAIAVFDNPGPNQLFVKMLQAVRGMDARGNIIDFHSVVQVRRGNQLITCTATVNTPCRAFGYNIHQAAFFADVARLRITAPDGQVVKDDVVDFQSESTAVPVLKVTDAKGNVLFDQELPQMGTDTGPVTSTGGATAAPATPSPNPAATGVLTGSLAQPLATAVLVFPSSPTGAPTDVVTEGVSWRVVNKQLVLSIQGQHLPPVLMNIGDSALDGQYRISFAGARPIPAVKVADVPGSITPDGSAIFQMPTDGKGNPYLYVTGIDPGNVALTDGQTVTPQNGYHYTFGGQVNAGGISVKRDPGSTFIWLAVGMAVIGLAITFYIPRRRLWVKVSRGRTFMAGIAERTTRFSLELRRLGAELGSTDALRPEDLEEER